MTLAKYVYILTESLPQKERYGLADQMQRAAVSIPSNIAEGSKRGSKKDYAHFLRMAHGSLAELETQLLLSREMYPQARVEKALDLALEVGKMLHAFTRTQDS